MAHTPWDDNIRAFYKANRKAVDQNLLRYLGKKVMAKEDTGYSCVGDYISDLALKEMHAMMGGLGYSEECPTIEHYKRRIRAKKAEAK